MRGTASVLMEIEKLNGDTLKCRVLLMKDTLKMVEWGASVLWWAIAF